MKRAITQSIGSDASIVDIRRLVENVRFNTTSRPRAHLSSHGRGDLKRKGVPILEDLSVPVFRRRRLSLLYRSEISRPRALD
jgi:hypothetical protein